MKNIFFILTAILIFNSCKKEKPKVEVKEEIKTLYSVDAATTDINLIAYKFTEKKGVKAKFTSLKIDNPIKSETKQGAFNDLKFSIPVTSFFSGDSIRDPKIKKLFFGVMKNTELLSGYFSDIKGNDSIGKMNLNLKMNDTTNSIVVDYKIDDRKVTINGELDILKFNGLEALNSIHEACKLLHTGSDGVAKTWETVDISAEVMFK